MINDMKLDVNRFFSFEKIKKNYFLFYRPYIFFLYFLKIEKSIDVSSLVLNYFPKFQNQIFIIVAEKWVKHNCSYGNYPKYYMPLTWIKNVLRD